MSALILWSALGVYALGWYLAAPPVVRSISTHTGERCHGLMGALRTQGSCRLWHDHYCWGEGSRSTPWRVAVGCAFAFVWPLLLVGWDVYRRSQGKPSRHDLTANIARLERELDLGDAS